MSTRRPIRPRRRALALGAGLVAALLLGLVVVLVGDGSPEPTSGHDQTPVELGAGPSAPSSPAAGSGATPSGVPTPVAAGERRVRKAVPLRASAHFDDALSLRVVRVEPVRGVARGPGEVAGPAVRMTVRLTNHVRSTLSLESVVIAVFYGADETPALTLSGSGARPFGGRLAPGRTQTARYVFAIPSGERDRVRLVASYIGTAPAVALVGSVA